MAAKINLALFFGGRSGEHDVSLMSARSVLAVLDPERYQVIPIGITQAGVWYTGENVLEALTAGTTSGLTPVTILPVPGQNELVALNQSTLQPLAHIDVAFPLLHGTFGEDGTLQGLFELAELAYIGAGVLGSALGMDKAVFKDLMRFHRIPVLDSILVTRSQLENSAESLIQSAEQLAPYPLFTKPANLGSSVGISKCHNRSDLFEGLMEAARYDRRILVERGLDAPREIELSVLGNAEPVASIPGEIIPADEFYSYRAKYLDNSTRLLIPALLSPELIAKVQAMGIQAYQAIDCAGMARVDFLIDRSTDEIFVSEINTIPGFTSISMYPKLWEASGLPYPALIDRLVDLAFERKQEREHTERHAWRGRNA
jgi:D-alanine-D-alanine ligase